MSRTDKTDPYWVRVTRYGIEHHNHERGPCDLHEWKPNLGWRYNYAHCYRALDWREGQSFYSTRTAWAANYYERSERNSVRMALRKYMDDDDIPDYRHRHGALWWD